MTLQAGINANTSEENMATESCDSASANQIEASVSNETPAEPSSENREIEGGEVK